MEASQISPPRRGKNQRCFQGNNAGQNRESSRPKPDSAADSAGNFAEKGSPPDLHSSNSSEPWKPWNSEISKGPLELETPTECPQGVYSKTGRTSGGTEEAGGADNEGAENAENRRVGVPRKLDSCWDPERLDHQHSLGKVAETEDWELHGCEGTLDLDSHWDSEELRNFASHHPG